MSRTRSAWLILTGVLSACSTIVGADFDDKGEGQPNGSGGGTSSGGVAPTSGGAATSGGSGGTSTGSGGKGTAGAGNGGGATEGGTTSLGGNAPAGGATPTGGTVATGGSLGSGGRTPEGGNGGDAGAGAEAGFGGTSGGEGGAAGSGGASGGSAGSGGFGGDGGLGGIGGEGGGGASPAVVVLNEVRGQGAGDDYIELANRGPGTAYLEGYGISDSNHTYVFPATAVVAPGGYLLILLNQVATGQFTCNTPNPCFHVSWGIAQSGETVYFRGTNNQVLDFTNYPDQGGPNGLDNDESWGRYPDGSGAFQATVPTAESTNQI